MQDSHVLGNCGLANGSLEAAQTGLHARNRQDSLQTEPPTLTHVAVFQQNRTNLDAAERLVDKINRLPRDT